MKQSEIIFTEPKLPEPKGESISDEKLHDLGLGTYGDNEKTVYRVRNDYHEAIRQLCRALCDDNDLPNDEEDIDRYIKNTREYRLGIALEFDNDQRKNAHNKAHFAIELLEDWIEQLDKADKK